VKKALKKQNWLHNILKNNDPNWDFIYSSPLSRAYETGAIIAKHLHLGNPIIHPGLIERNFGALEGTTINDQTFPTIMREEVLGLETKKALQTRVIATLREIYQKHSNDKILITTHSHFIKGLLSTILMDFDFGSWLQNGSLHYFAITEDKITLVKYNQSPN
jgi:broad specificity phosphatase PhoE